MIIATILIILSYTKPWSGGFYVFIVIFGFVLIVAYMSENKNKKIRAADLRRKEQDEEDRKRKSDWEYGEIPIINSNNGNVNSIPKESRHFIKSITEWEKSTEYCLKNYPSLVKDLSISNPFNTFENYKDTENRLLKIPEYCYLCENGRKFSYKSIFHYLNENYDYKNYFNKIQNTKSNKDISGPFFKGENIFLDTPKKKSLDISTINYQAIRNNFKIIEYLSLNEIKLAAKEVKSKIQEEKYQIENEKKEKQIIIERWDKIANSFKFEILDINNNSFLSGIYIIHCVPTNHIYIGSSDNMAIRKSQHLQQLRSKSHHSYRLQESFNQHGESCFKFYAIETITLNSDVVNSSRILKQIEQYYITEYRPEFNIEQDAFGKRHYTR